MGQLPDESLIWIHQPIWHPNHITKPRLVIWYVGRWVAVTHHYFWASMNLKCWFKTNKWSVTLEIGQLGNTFYTTESFLQIHGWVWLTNCLNNWMNVVDKVLDISVWVKFKCKVECTSGMKTCRSSPGFSLVCLMTKAVYKQINVVLYTGCIHVIIILLEFKFGKECPQSVLSGMFSGAVASVMGFVWSVNPSLSHSLQLN